MNYDVAIIGAGISGLTVAHSLSQKGLNVVVLERQQQVGGNAVSEKTDGFLMEHGPTTLNAIVPQALELSSQLGIDHLKLDLGDGVKKRYLLDQGKLHGISTNPAGFLLSPYLSLKGRLSLMAEFLRPVKTDDSDETVHAFAVRRFGREFADRVMEPLVAGMFGGDASKTSLQGVFSKFHEMEKKHGSLIRATIKAAPKSEPGKRLFSFRNGVATIPHSLARLSGAVIKTGTVVKKLTRSAGGFNIETAGKGNLTTRSLVLAVQPHVAAQLLENLDPLATQAAMNIDAPPMSTMFFGWKRSQVEHPLDSLGVLSTKQHDGIITGIQFPSTMFENRAPDGMVAISAYVGGTRNRAAAQMDPNELTRQVCRELSNLLGITAQPTIVKIHQWARSLPQYELGHAQQIEPLTSLNDRHPGLFVTGNYLHGVSIANCISQAKTTAQKVDTYLCATHHHFDAAKDELLNRHIL